MDFVAFMRRYGIRHWLLCRTWTTWGGLGLGMTLSDRMDPLTDRDLQKASCGPVLINQGS